MAALRRERVVDERGHEAVDPELLRDPAAARLAVGALRAVEPGHERELRAPQRIGARLLVLEPRLLRQHEVELAAGPVHLDAAHGGEEFRVERALRHELEVGALRVGVRDDEAGVDDAAVREHDAARARPPSMRIARDFGARPDLDADAAAGRGHRLP